MVRYWFSFTPLVVVATVVLLALPWLGVIALMLFTLAALATLAALVAGVVVAPYMLVRSVGRRRHNRRGMVLQPVRLAAARPPLEPTQSIPAGATLFLGGPPSEPERLT
jgi:hypothetical protein